MSGLRSRESSTMTPSPTDSLDLELNSFTRSSSGRLVVEPIESESMQRSFSSPRPHKTAHAVDLHEPLWPIALVGCLVVAVIGVGLGVASNHGNTKFIRLVAQEGCLSSWKNIAATTGSAAAELKCCPSVPRPFDYIADHSTPITGESGSKLAGGAADGAQWDAVCASSYRMEAALSTLWGAWLVPLLPLAISGLAGVGSSRSQYGSSGSGSSSGSQCAGWSFSLRARLCGYLSLMFLRTTLLYGGLNVVEDWVEAQGWFGPRDVDCGYAHLRRSQACKEPWDAADHIVLLTLHHITVAGSELAVLLQHASRAPTAILASTSASTRLAAYDPLRSSSAAVYGAAFGAAFAELGGIGPAIGALSAVVVCISAAYCLRQTAALFHVPSESAAALALALCSVAFWRACVVAYSKRAAQRLL